MDRNEYRTHILIDEARRWARLQAYHRRQRGRKEAEHKRIANSCAEQGKAIVDELRKRAQEGDLKAGAYVANAPPFAVEEPLI